MAADPDPCDGVRGGGGLHRLPQIAVFNGFVLAVFPAAFNPAGEPFGEAFEHVLAIGMERKVAGLFEGIAELDDGHHFHTVVGGVGLAAATFFFMAVPLNEVGPAAGAGVAGAGAIGVGVEGVGG